MTRFAAYQARVRERQRLYILGVCHEVTVWPELARKASRIE